MTKIFLFQNSYFANLPILIIEKIPPPLEIHFEINIEPLHTDAKKKKKNERKRKVREKKRNSMNKITKFGREEDELARHSYMIPHSMLCQSAFL